MAGSAQHRGARVDVLQMNAIDERLVAVAQPLGPARAGLGWRTSSTPTWINFAPARSVGSSANPYLIARAA